jgi:hypothetical protein
VGFGEPRPGGALARGYSGSGPKSLANSNMRFV